MLLAREDVADDHHDDACRFLRGSEPVATLDLAYYEVTNVAVRAWHDPSAARRLRGAVRALQDDGGLVRGDEALAAAATELAEGHDLSAYDAAYVAAATAIGARLVSCDVRDLVSSGLAVLPGKAVA
ncbi:MAG: PIN domain-containing protein [Thermoleophilaceae bacterium]|nr:PIN domain-containing protein [Thermoleophilaceae bacterium]